MNKNVAHLDLGRLRIDIPLVHRVERAILSYHAVYRKYACIIAGIGGQLANLNPLDLLPPIDVDYKQQFTRTWAGATKNHS